MKHRVYIVVGLILSGLLATTSITLASTCVDCHTDVDKLKAIAKTIPQKAGSTETAGKG